MSKVLWFSNNCYHQMLTVFMAKKRNFYIDRSCPSIVIVFVSLCTNVAMVTQVVQTDRGEQPPPHHQKNIASFQNRTNPVLWHKKNSRVFQIYTWNHNVKGQIFKSDNINVWVWPLIFTLDAIRGLYQNCDHLKWLFISHYAAQRWVHIEALTLFVVRLGSNDMKRQLDSQWI